MWSTADVAAHLGVTESTVRDYAARGLIAAAGYGKGRAQYDPAAIRAWHAGRPGRGAPGRPRPRRTA